MKQIQEKKTYVTDLELCLGENWPDVRHLLQGQVQRLRMRDPPLILPFFFKMAAANTVGKNQLISWFSFASDDVEERKPTSCKGI